MMGQFLTPSEEEVDVEVRWEDQKRINSFGTLNNRKHELEEEIEALKQKVDDFENAEEEMMLAEGDNAVMLRIGTDFVGLEDDEATAFLEAETEKAQAALAAARTEVESIVKQQGELKTQLYARFGKSINLED